MRKIIGTILLIMMMTFIFKALPTHRKNPTGDRRQWFTKLCRTRIWQWTGKMVQKWLWMGNVALFFLAIYGLAYIIWKFIAMLIGKVNLNSSP